MTIPPKLEHPCKETCSGWSQGYERGSVEKDAIYKRIIAKELTENDALGLEFVYVMALKEEILRKDAEIKILEDKVRQWCESYAICLEAKYGGDVKNSELKEHISKMSCCCAGCTKHNLALEQNGSDQNNKTTDADDFRF